MRPRLGDFLAVLTLLVLALGGFARLVALPRGLIVDGRRASVDHAQREDVRVLGNDLTYTYLPHHAHVAAAVAAHGCLPQWDTLGFAGRPMVGNPQGGLFYPPVWLAWGIRSPAALGWLTLGHLLAAGAGTYVLMRSVGAGRVASTIAAGCFQSSPYVLAHTFEGHYAHVWAVCWYPWAFWAFGRSRAGGARGTLALPPILALTFLTGHPQEWYYLVVVLSLWAVGDAAHAAWSGRRRAAAIGLATWVGLVALSMGLVAVELLPDLAAQRWTLRSTRLALARVSHYHLQPLNLFQLLGPDALGGPYDYFGRDNYWETVLSIGLIPLVLAAVAAAYHPDRELVRGWLALVGGSVVFAAGRRLLLFPVLFAVIPGMERFRVPSRSLFLASLGGAVLAGLGVEALARGNVPGEDWRRLALRGRQVATAVVLGLVLLACLAPRIGTRATVLVEPPKARRASDLTSSPIPIPIPIPPYRGAAAAARLLGSGTFWFALVATLGALGWGCRSGVDRRLPASFLGLLALVELGLHAYAILEVSPPSNFLGPDPIGTALARAGRPASGPFRIRARDTLYSDLRAFSNGNEKVNITDSFQIQHAADLYETLYPLLYVLPSPDPDDALGTVVARFRHDVRQGVLDRLGVAFLVSDHVEPEPSWPVVASGRLGDSPFAVQRNPTAMPRAYVVPRAEPTPDDAPTILARFRQLDPRQAVLLPDDPLGPDGPRQPFTPAEWCGDDPDHVVLKVTTGAPGLLVVADTWMPGWSALVDGRPAPILRGNHAQRVVPLPASGRHRIDLRYQAPGFAWGLAITLASVLAWGAAALARSGRPARRRCGDVAVHRRGKTAAMAACAPGGTSVQSSSEMRSGFVVIPLECRDPRGSLPDRDCIAARRNSTRFTG